MSSVPVQRPAPTPPAENPDEKFRRLARTWREETAYLSSSTRMFAHPAYQEIIRMGDSVVPLLTVGVDAAPARIIDVMPAVLSHFGVAPPSYTRALQRVA